MTTHHRRNIISEHIPLSEKIKLYQNYLERDPETINRYKLKKHNSNGQNQLFSISLERFTSFWQDHHIKIQAKYGNICLCYFTLHKWLFLINSVIAFLILIFLFIPNLVLRKYNLYINSFDNTDQERCFLTANGQNLPNQQEQSNVFNNIEAMHMKVLWHIPWHFYGTKYGTFYGTSLAQNTAHSMALSMALSIALLWHFLWHNSFRYTNSV